MLFPYKAIAPADLLFNSAGWHRVAAVALICVMNVIHVSIVLTIAIRIIVVIVISM